MNRGTASFRILIFFLCIVSTRLSAKEEERWINFYDSSRGLWAKQNSLTREVLYLYRYGESRDMVSYLTEEEIESVQAKALLFRIRGTGSEGYKRGFGESVFRTAATVPDVIRLIEEAGWRKSDYRDGMIIYRKELVENPLLVPADRGKKLNINELRDLLNSAGLPLPVSHPVSPDHRNQ
jgi:hypothetical protein